MNSKWMKNFLALFVVMGPGIVTGIVGLDAGGIATYSLAGAHFGYSMMWALIPITFVSIIVQEMCARMGVVTGKGFADLIRENFGVKITFFVLLAFFLVTLTNLVSEIAGIAASAEIFGIKKYYAVPLAALAVWLVVVKGTYKSAEKIFLTSCVLYVTYLISGFLVRPDWGAVAKGMLIPTFNFGSSAYFMLFTGLVGTTIAPWMQFYLQASVVEKGIPIEKYKHVKLDVIIGTSISSLLSLFIMIACASTLFKDGIVIKDAADAALALKPLVGDFCGYLFAFGLLNASLAAASVVPLATTYSICEGFGWESGINKKFREAPQFYIIFTVLIVVGSIIVMIPGFPLILGMYMSQVVNGILLPFLLIFVLLLINKRELMGGYVNSRTYNIIAWITVIVLIALSLGMLAAM